MLASFIQSSCKIFQILVDDKTEITGLKCLKYINVYKLLKAD